MVRCLPRAWRCVSFPFMTAPSGPRPVDRTRSHGSLSQTIEVETPELVVFSYTIAGVGSRALAALIDSLLCLALILTIVFGIGVLSPRSGARAAPGIFEAWATAIFIFAVFCVFWGYYVLFEGLADGQTLGKRLLRLRVVRDG